MIFDVRQAIIDRLRATKRKNIERVIDYMEKNGFFTAQCGRHHKYPGGLTSHSWQTYQIALRLDAERCANNPNAQKLDADSLAICTLLHDMCGCSGMRDTKGHGIRSAIMLMELGLALSHEEYLAIRFHMSIKNKTTHPSYDDALNSQLRDIVHNADKASAILLQGYEDPDTHKNKEDLQPYLCNITKLDSIDIIYQVDGGWFMNLHSPHTGELDSTWKDKIIGVKEYDAVDLYGINDSIIGAIFVIERGDKKGLFVLHHCFGMQGGAYFSPDKDPFIYSEIKIYCDWYGWNDYGYAACKQHNGWKLVKVTQFPMPKYEVIGEGFSSAEGAMESIGIVDCDKYLYDNLFPKTYNP